MLFSSYITCFHVETAAQNITPVCHLGRSFSSPPSLLPLPTRNMMKERWNRGEGEVRENGGHLGRFICYSIIKKWTCAIDEVVLPQLNQCRIHIPRSLPLAGWQDLIINTGHSAALYSLPFYRHFHGFIFFLSLHWWTLYLMGLIFTRDNLVKLLSIIII